MVERIIIQKTADLLSSAIGSLFKKKRLMAAEKRSGKLIAEAIRELLSVDPNLHKVRSKLILAEEEWPKPTEDLLRAKEMLERVMVSSKRKIAVSVKRPKKKTQKKKTASRETPKKRPTKKNK